jgi:manganese/zinc/iron transport system permease protein
MDTFWIILTGALVAICSGLLGCFLLLRKMVMVGDAISHAVLPGIVLAYLVAQSRASMPMLIGAGIFGILITILIEVLHQKARMQSDAAIGFSFTTLFAVGVILIAAFADKVDLDQDCVLYGEIAYVPLDTIQVGGMILPKAVCILSGLLIGILIFLRIALKALLITTFDEVFAASLGVSTAFWHYALMSAVSFSTVLSFESVGAILVVAFIIGPPSCAYLLTRQLHKMLLFTLILGVISAVGGYYLAVAVNGSIAGAMATVVGIEFLLVFLYVKCAALIFKKALITKSISAK